MLFFPLNKYGKNHASLIVGAVGICAALSYVIYPNFVNRELMYFCIWWLGVAAARLYVQGEPISIMQLKNELMPVFGITLILLVNALSKGDFSHWGIHPLLELRHFAFSLIVLFFAMQWKKFPLLQRKDRWLVMSGDAKITQADRVWSLIGKLGADAAYFKLPKMPPPSLSARPRFRLCPGGRCLPINGISVSIMACRISICRVMRMQS